VYDSLQSKNRDSIFCRHGHTCNLEIKDCRFTNTNAKTALRNSKYSYSPLPIPRLSVSNAVPRILNDCSQVLRQIQAVIPPTPHHVQAAPANFRERHKLNAGPAV
jgi:hypothetical protein